MQGGCYCGALRFETTAKPVQKGQCHCRECQYFASGAMNFYLVIPEAGFTYTTGTPACFTRSDLENPVTREFCGTCGTPVLTRRIGLPMVILKAGVLDNPSDYGDSSMAIFMKDAQPFHVVRDGKPCFQDMPPRT
ncbi:MAG: GFA family protein [Paracoccaceae bacterium]